MALPFHPRTTPHLRQTSNNSKAVRPNCILTSCLLQHHMTWAGKPRDTAGLDLLHTGRHTPAIACVLCRSCVNQSEGYYSPVGSPPTPSHNTAPYIPVHRSHAVKPKPTLCGSAAATSVRGRTVVATSQNTTHRSIRSHRQAASHPTWTKKGTSIVPTALPTLPRPCRYTCRYACNPCTHPRSKYPATAHSPLLTAGPATVQQAE